jgi:hypothetical protein
MSTTRRELLALAGGAAAAAAVAPGAAAVAAPGHGDRSWVGTWAAVPTTVPPAGPAVLENQTVRHVVHTSIGGDELRIRLTNEFGETILPFKDDTLGFYSAENERKRSAVNTWIRRGGEYDGVIDFDTAVRDPADPLRLLAAYDSGDHLHPDDAGMAAMAAAVPLRLFR